MDFKKFRTFIEVVEAGGVTQAANNFFRTQQAISMQIRQLEEALGFPLFDRAGPQIFLTKQGKCLYEKLSGHFFEMESFLLDMKSEGNRAKAINLGVWLEQGTKYLPDLITKFRGTCSDVNFNIFLGTNDELEEMLNNNDIDFGFLSYTNNAKLFNRYQVLRRELIFVASKDYLDKRGPIRTAEDTLDRDLLDYPYKHSCYMYWIKRNAKKLLMQAQRKKPIVTVTNDIILKELVINGNGIAFLPRDIVTDELRTGKVVELFSNRHPTVINIDVVYKKKCTMSIHQKQFLDFIRNHDDLMRSGSDSFRAVDGLSSVG